MKLHRYFNLFISIAIFLFLLRLYWHPIADIGRFVVTLGTGLLLMFVVSHKTEIAQALRALLIAIFALLSGIGLVRNNYEPSAQIDSLLEPIHPFRFQRPPPQRI